MPNVMDPDCVVAKLWEYLFLAFSVGLHMAYNIAFTIMQTVI